MKTPIILTIGALALAAGSRADAAAPEGFQAFAEQHCFVCHGPEKQKGKLRLDTFAWEPSDPENLELWYEIADLIEIGEMPPDDEPQPTDAEKEKILSSIQQSLQVTEGKSEQAEVSLRRLNRVQYRNSLRDLLGIDLTDDPTTHFPSDGETHGFDTVSKTLVTSNFVMQSYLKAADMALNRASFFQSEPSAPQSHSLEPFRGTVVYPEQDYFDLATTEYSIVNFPSKLSIAPQGERYRFTLEVEGRPKDEDGREFFRSLGYNSEDEVVLGIYLNQEGTGLLESAIIKTHSMVVLPAGERTKIEKEIHIPQGWQLVVRYETGPVGFRPWKSGNVLPSIEHELTTSEIKKGRDRSAAGLRGIRGLNTPRIRFHEVTLEGPLHDEWPPASHQRLYGEDRTNEETVREFAERAFRRPVSEEELLPFLELAGDSPEELQSALRAVLCAPQFTYLYENEGALDDYAVASRLSYFLWNTMPDRELLSLAENGRLRAPAVLREQVERLLQDPRSASFRHSFVFQWLHLKNSLEMSPDRKAFREFHTRGIQSAMTEETVAFISHLLDKNLPVANLVSSDFLLLNSKMARFYGIEDVHHFDYQPVSLPASQAHRSGLLGQSSVLTASANGIETSPVVRGIWVLENLLGTPPAAPPDDIEVPEPDVRGAKTVRELLAKHRDVESCNDCHRSIDPIGFALENFDPVGLWREHYPALDPETDEVIQGREIDAAGSYAGQDFDNIVGLKEILLRKEKLLTRNLANKLLLSGTGREMEVADRPAIDAIVAQSEQSGGGLREHHQA